MHKKQNKTKKRQTNTDLHADVDWNNESLIVVLCFTYLSNCHKLCHIKDLPAYTKWILKNTQNADSTSVDSSNEARRG